MESLNLNVLNDQIISMRKEVKKAMVRQVHHMTKVIRTLRSKKGTEEQKQKNASKADRLVSEIQILKNINPDDVSLFGFSNLEENNLKAFMSKQIIAHETKLMAKLCLQKNLRNVIDQFIARLSGNIDLLNKVLEERFERKMKNKKKNKKMVGDNIASECSSDSGESIPELVPSELNDSNMGSLNIKNNLLNGNKKNYAKKVDEKPEKIKKSNLESSNLESRSIPTSSDFETNATPDLDEQNTKLDSTSIEGGKIENRPSERKNVDPFFLSRNDSEYRTYCNIEANKKWEKEENLSEKHNTSQNFTNYSKKDIHDRREHRSGYFNRNNQHPKFDNKTTRCGYFNRNNQHPKFDNKTTKCGYFNRNNQRPEFENKRTIINFGGGRERSFVKKGRTNSESFPSRKNSTLNVKLHPSWEAKKKLSIASVPFQGKKITFEE